MNEENYVRVCRLSYDKIIVDGNIIVSVCLFGRSKLDTENFVNLPFYLLTNKFKT